MGIYDLPGKIKKLIDEAPAELQGEDSRSNLFRKICAFIPGKIDNILVVYAFELMRKEQQFRKKHYKHHEANERIFRTRHKPVIQRNHGFIEDQNNYKDMLYGESNIQYAGCEILAAFNALNHLFADKEVSLPKLIEEFEKDGMVLSGRFGTSPKAIQDCLTRHGLKTSFITREADFDRVAKTVDSLILTLYNDKDDITQEVHTIYISKEPKGYVAHNAYGNGTVLGPYKSLKDLFHHFNRGKARGISLIGIKK